MSAPTVVELRVGDLVAGAVELDQQCPGCDLATHPDTGEHAEIVGGRVVRTWTRSATHHRDCDCLDCRYPDQT